MNFNELKHYFDHAYAVSAAQWRKRNCYYYHDVERLMRFAIPEGSRVLQVGIDDGWLLSRLKPSRGVYVALSGSLADEGRSQFPEITFFEDRDLAKLDIDERFDYVVLSNVIGVVPDIQSFFARLGPVVTPSTRMIVTYYNYLWEPLIKCAEAFGLKQRLPIQNWLSSSDINNLLNLAGFEIIKEGRRLLFPKYIPIISTLLNRGLARLPFIDRLNFWNYCIARPRPSYRQRSLRVSVVVPARNEKGNIESIVRRIPDMGTGTEIVFVEGNSTDDTWEEVKRVAEQYKDSKRILMTQQEGKGKGDAVRKGFTRATGDILMILDADMTVPPEDLPRFYDVIASGMAEYVHGTRLVYPMEKEAMRFLNLLANKFFSLVFSWLLRQRFKDTLCGTKVLTKENYEKLAANRHYFGDFDPFGDFDLIFGASKLGLKIMEIPVHYKERTYGTTNISRFRHGWLLLKMCFFAAKKLE